MIPFSGANSVVHGWVETVFQRICSVLEVVSLQGLPSIQHCVGPVYVPQNSNLALSVFVFDGNVTFNGNPNVLWIQKL